MYSSTHNPKYLSYLYKYSSSVEKIMKRYGVHGVHVRSSGKAEILNVDLDIQPVGHRPDKNEYSTTIALESGAVPTWVYPASIVSGLLILACIVLCLCAVSFQLMFHLTMSYS